MWQQTDQQDLEQAQNEDYHYNDNESENDDERKCTNIPALVVCIIFVIAMISLVGYCGIKGDFSKISIPQDDCGNFCGQLNEQNRGKCKSTDMRNLTKLLITNSTDQKCVQTCPKEFGVIFNRCIKTGQDTESFVDVPQAFASTWYLILFVCIVAFVFSFICLLLYRYCAEYVIWIINIGFIVFLLVLGVLLLTKILGNPEPKVAIGCFIAAAISIVVLVIFRNEIALVAQIFKEASKALMDVPGSMAEPVLTFIALLTSIVAFIFFILLIEVFNRTYTASYKISPIAIAAHILNGIAFIWFTQFIFGCQHFIIAGTISKWYFTRDKSKLESPIWNSFVQLVSFHLGSVCFGSMLIAVMKIIKMIFKAIKSAVDKDSDSGVAQCLACMCMCVIDLIDQALEYLVRNAYIIIAVDGTPFFESGKRAFNLIKGNLDQCYSVNQFGDIVLMVCRMLITAMAGFIAYEIMKKPSLVSSSFYPMITSVIFAFFIAHCFVTVFEMTVDTIFICYCIDLEENNGDERPYFMSDKLRVIMEELRSKDTGSENENFGDDGNNMQMQEPSSYGPNEYPVVQQPAYYDPNLQQQQYGGPYYPNQGLGPQYYPNQGSGAQYYPQQPYAPHYQDQTLQQNYPQVNTPPGQFQYPPQMGPQNYYPGYPGPMYPPNQN